MPFAPVARRPHGRDHLAALGGLLAVLVLLGGTGLAQESRAVPGSGYYAAFGLFYEGDYEKALKLFQIEGRGAIKTVQSRWIDSICFHTMSGECYFHMGNLPKAMEHYTSALQLFLAFQDWMMRVNFVAVRPAGPGQYRPVPWGQPQRQVVLGHYPDKMLISQGRVNNNDVIRQGGVVQQAVQFPVEVQEIVRCTCLALRRRAMLLGPIARHDPLTGELIAALSRRPGPPNHWSECWIDLQLGLALVAGGKEDQALVHLQRSVLAAGQFDHPLTGVALLELGRLALARGDYANATKSFAEASYAAVQYPDAGLLEEAFRLGAVTHLMANRQGPFAALAPAAAWAKVKRYRQLQASLLVSMAENFTVLGEPARALATLGEAAAVMAKRDMAAGWLGARLHYVTAVAGFQQKKAAEGSAALARAMAYMQAGGSLWLYQIGVADGMVTTGAASERVAMELYEILLRDPQGGDWSFDPLESLAVLMTPHPLPLEHWFEVALGRNEQEKALEIADRARRHRFFSAMAFGGRLQALRWVLESPLDRIDNEARLHRQDLLVKYPAYEQWTTRAQTLSRQLATMPLAATSPEALRAQGTLLGQLAEVSVQQEALLREMAVRRDPAKMAFPPLRPIEEIQKALPEGHAMLAFFSTTRHLYAFLMNQKQYAVWQVGAPALLYKQVQGLMRELGLYEQNTQVTLKELANPRWRQASAELLKTLLAGSNADFATDFEELVIVPDGFLWHVPFEALHVSVGGQLEPLISRVRIRYVPTAGLAVRYGPGRQPTARTAVIVGKLFPQDDPAVAAAQFARIASALPGTSQLSAPLPGPSGYLSAAFDRLIVLDDLPVESNPFDLAPAVLDRGKPGSTLNDWLALPWKGPDEIILPGFHTAAENSLKNVNPVSAGHEVFLTVCGLMSSGARTILLSRWRTGGQTSYDLVREFAQELPHTSPADAWQRAVFLTADSAVEPDREPRIKRTAADQPPRADHAFFWAGYLLVDAGTIDAPVDLAPEEPAAPAAEMKPPAVEEPGEKPEEKPEAEPAAPEPPAPQRRRPRR